MYILVIEMRIIAKVKLKLIDVINSFIIINVYFLHVYLIDLTT